MTVLLFPCPLGGERSTYLFYDSAFISCPLGGEQAKYNFWQQTLRNPRATYVCMNKGEALAPREIRSQSICIDADIGAALSTLTLSDSESSIL